MGNARAVEGGSDQYYTRPELARSLVDGLRRAGLLGTGVAAVEPSAGAGAFVEPLAEACRSVTAIDIEPAHPAVAEGDFLSFDRWPVPEEGGGSRLP